MRPVKKHKDQTLQKELLNLENEVATNLSKVDDYLNKVKECFVADNGPIYQQRVDLVTHRKKTIETIEKKVKRKISLSGYLCSKKYTNEKVMNQNLMLAVKDKNLTIDDFLTLKNSQEINDFHLTRGQLEDIELAGRLTNLSEKNEKFSSWNEFIIPNAGEMISDEKVEEMLKNLVYFNDEPLNFNNSSFSSFPKNNSAWEKLFEETKIKIIEFNIRKDEEELKKINEKEKELETQLATLRKEKAESQKQKVVATINKEEEKNSKITNLSLKDKKK